MEDIRIIFMLAAASYLVAVFVYEAMRRFTFEDGLVYKSRAGGEKVGPVRHGRVKYALYWLVFGLSIVSLAVNSALFLFRAGAPVLTVEKTAFLVGCLLIGYFCRRLAERMKVASRLRAILAEVLRQTLYALNIFGKGGAWMISISIASDFDNAMAIICTLCGLGWAIRRLRKAD